MEPHLELHFLLQKENVLPNVVPKLLFNISKLFLVEYWKRTNDDVSKMKWLWCSIAVFNVVMENDDTE